MIKECCICKSKDVEKVLDIPFRDILGKPSGQTWNPSIAICKQCGFIFQQNPFTEDELENRYKNLSKFEFDSKDYIPTGDDDYSKRCLRQKHFLQESIGDFNSILEVGAASGYNLSLYRKEKIVYGVEPSNNNCKLAKRLYDVDMFNGMFADFIKSDKVADNGYDLIFTSMVLEHIVNPYEFISQCANICNKYFFVEVPAMDYKFVDEPFGMICEEHVNLFTFEGLNSLMNAAGFDLLNAEICFEPSTRLPAGYPSYQTVWIKTDKRTILKKYTQNSLLVFNAYIEANTIELHKVEDKINQIPDTEKLALWGAGHHLSMLLANTCLANKNIVRVFDSDLRKRGQKIMNCPIGPFNEDDVEAGQIDSILITTYVAQKAIMKFLSNERLQVKVYTLYDNI